MNPFQEYTLVQRALILAALLMAPILASGQVDYDAERAPISLSAGGSFSYFGADYGGYHVMGPTAFVDFSPIIWDHVAAEAEGRWLTLNASQGFREYNYLIGPVYRITLTRHPSLHPYVKGLVGAGIIDFPNNLAYGRYFAIAPGGGVDFTLSRRVRLRADYEFQIWPNAPDIPGTPGGTMTPNGVSVGVTYRIF
jgi:opacity protein-like surface antigen